ncbi:FAD dependent oxidoreductase [Reticulomyxa filosa]|uniref:FAD-dependent oxidoreductase domain-containing protein 1 n=1 Tax=Reticulomyxa filosa TaxID=46433 RepID=X6MVW0_RETFI|nr:FAD dependent oxidoreductase [Reticulomyxa filosa]|eukprot:ETO17240.1 FAD dependent oxidoreductase [Reticulomyxa filosa]
MTLEQMIVKKVVGCVRIKFEILFKQNTEAMHHKPINSIFRNADSPPTQRDVFFHAVENGTLGLRAANQSLVIVSHNSLFKIFLAMQTIFFFKIWFSSEESVALFIVFAFKISSGVVVLIYFFAVFSFYNATLEEKTHWPLIMSFSLPLKKKRHIDYDDQKTDYDVVVICAGIAGASMSYNLALQGLSVYCLEQEERPGYHSTGRAAGLFSENYGTPAVQIFNICVIIIDVNAFNCFFCPFGPLPPFFLKKNYFIFKFLRNKNVQSGSPVLLAWLQRPWRVGEVRRAGDADQQGYTQWIVGGSYEGRDTIFALADENGKKFWYLALQAKSGLFLASPANRDLDDHCDVALCVDQVETYCQFKVDKIVSKWSGHRCHSPDWNFVLGGDPADDSFVWTAALAGQGIQACPAYSLLNTCLALKKSIPNEIADLDSHSKIILDTDTFFYCHIVCDKETFQKIIQKFLQKGYFGNVVDTPTRKQILLIVDISLLFDVSITIVVICGLQFDQKNLSKNKETIKKIIPKNFFTKRSFNKKFNKQEKNDMS